MDRWPAIDPGDLHNRIEIQKPIETQDTNGALLQNWTTHAMAWARIDPYGGGEKWGDAALQTTNLFKVWIRYCAGVTTKMRVSFNGRILDIKNVENVLERNIVQILTCMERFYDETGVRVQ